MKLSSLIQPKLVKCGLTATNKDEALKELVQVLVDAQPGLTAPEILQALADREKQGPFSMGKGVAFPHARTEKVADFTMVIGTAPAGIDFKAPDGNRIRILVLFVIPKKHSNLYLHTLAQFLNLFAVEAQANHIIEAKTGEEMLAAIDAATGRTGPGSVRESTVHGIPTVTGATTLSRAVDLMVQNKLDALPVVDAEGNLAGEVSATAVLQIGVRDHLRALASPASLKTTDAFENLIRLHGETTIESVPGLLSANGFRTVQEDEPVLDVALRLAGSGARTAWVLKGRRVVGMLTLNDLLKKLTARKSP